MRKPNTEVTEELGILLRRIDRIREGFRLEKEEALKNPGRQVLLNLRECSRMKYQIQLADINRELIKLTGMINSDGPGREEAEDIANHTDSVLRDLQANLISTPNRLLRVLRSGAIDPGLKNSNPDTDSSLKS